MPINAISQFANFLTVTLTKSESCNYSTSAQSWQVSINVRRIRERTNEAWDFFLHDALLVSCCNKNEGALHSTWKLKQNSNNLPSFTQCTMAMFQWVVKHSEFPTFCQLWKKISLLLSISMIFASNSPCKSYENEQNPYFSDFECNFRLLGGVFHKCSQSKYRSIHQDRNIGIFCDGEKGTLPIVFSSCLFSCFLWKINLQIWICCDCFGLVVYIFLLCNLTSNHK